MNPATLTVTNVTASNKQYDATTTTVINASGAVLSGFVNGDSTSTVQVNSTGATGTFKTPNVGQNIPVTVTGLGLMGTSAANYVLQEPTDVTGTITPAPLTLTANSLTMNQGGPVPTLTYTATGFKGSDTTAVLTTQPTLSTTATSSSPAGTYPININGGAAANYTITDVPGTLTVVISTGTTTTVTSSSPLAVAGQPVTFTATVKPVSTVVGQPTGTVFFLANNNVIGAATLDPTTGVATLTTTASGYGSASITAVYAGDSSFQSSTSSAIQEFVTSAGTTPSLSVVTVRNRQGKIVGAELEAQILVTSPGTGTPTGVATFFVNGRAFLPGGTRHQWHGRAGAPAPPGPEQAGLRQVSRLSPNLPAERLDEPLHQPEASSLRPLRVGHRNGLREDSIVPPGQPSSFRDHESQQGPSSRVLELTVERCELLESKASS